ncbi:MAG: type II toxin-antitoxin system PemK/MazF family toxin [Alphaproteobacteria bacterium]|nr:type II toxin-antitoxin system PemK/MazF family toxin [Alphaproteobacteria bacterium]
MSDTVKALAIKRWDIVVVPFPYIDSAKESKRPALIISDAAMHEEFDTCWAMMITSAKKSRWECDIAINNLTKAGLPVPCVIRPVKLAAIDLSRILRKTGSLDTSERRKISKFLQHQFLK